MPDTPTPLHVRSGAAVSPGSASPDPVSQSRRHVSNNRVVFTRQPSSSVEMAGTENQLWTDTSQTSVAVVKDSTTAAMNYSQLHADPRPIPVDQPLPPTALRESSPVFPQHHAMPGVPNAKNEEAMIAQEALQDAREELLGARFALRARRTQVTNLRQETSETEGAILSIIRRMFEEQDFSFSAELEKIYQKLVTLRNRLGSAEVDYDESEQSYNRLEWKYTQREGDFVEKLSSNQPSLYDTRYVEERLRETETLTKHAVGSGEPLNDTLIDENRSKVSPANVELIKSASAPELQSHQALITGSWRVQSKDHSVPGSTPTRPPLTSYFSQDELDPRRTAPSAPYSESALSHGRLTWPDTVQRIDSWIFDTVECSPLQQARLKQMLSLQGLNDPSWWQLVVKHWSSSDPKNSQINRGGEEPSTSHATTVTAADSSAPVSTFRQANTQNELAKLPIIGPDVGLPIQPTALIPGFSRPTVLEDTQYPRISSPSAFAEAYIEGVDADITTERPDIQTFDVPEGNAIHSTEEVPQPAGLPNNANEQLELSKEPEDASGTNLSDADETLDHSAPLRKENGSVSIYRLNEELAIQDEYAVTTDEQGAYRRSRSSKSDPGNITECRTVIVHDLSMEDNHTPRVRHISPERNSGNTEMLLAPSETSSRPMSPPSTRTPSPAFHTQHVQKNPPSRYRCRSYSESKLA